MKRQYDLAIGLGAACSCSQILRHAGLQKLSFPFDWLTPADTGKTYEEDLIRRTAHICADFDGWIRKEDFHTRGENDGDHLTNGMIDYVNTRLGLQFIHDFPRLTPFDQVFPAVQAKYQRRIDRFLGLLRRSQRILVLRVERPDLEFSTPIRDFETARGMLQDKYPDKRFDFIAFVPCLELPYAQRRIEHPTDWLTLVSFDYRSHQPNVASNQPDFETTRAVLLDLASVRDYRTQEEIRQHRESTRRKKLAAAGCDTKFQYHLQRWRNAVLGKLPSVRGDILAPFFRRKFDHVLPLGTNCEVAFRFFRRWGFVESSLFAWARSFDLTTLTHALSNFESVMAGEAVFDPGSFMWRCKNTGLYFHGKMKHIPRTPIPPPEIRSEDLRDLRDRITHLKQKFISIIAGDETVLFVHRLAKEDAQAKDLEARLAALERALSSLHAKNCTLLVVCERADRPRMPVKPAWIFRSVRKFNPTKQVTNEKLGDSHGWNAIFAEFAPRTVLAQKHKFKFE